MPRTEESSKITGKIKVKHSKRFLIDIKNLIPAKFKGQHKLDLKLKIAIK